MHVLFGQCKDFVWRQIGANVFFVRRLRLAHFLIYRENWGIRMESEKGYTCYCVGPEDMYYINTDFFERLERVLKELIEEKKVTTFLFESKKGFEGICVLAVWALRLRYPHILRVVMKSEEISREDFFFLDAVEGFNDFCYPGKVLPNGKVYQGKEEIAGLCDFCIVYDRETDELQIKKT